MFAAALAVVLLPPLSPPKEKGLSEAAKGELKKLEGSWEVVRIESGGRKLEPGPDERIVLTIKGAGLKSERSRTPGWWPSTPRPTRC